MKKTLLLAGFTAATLFSSAQNSFPYWSLAGNSNATTLSKLGTTNAIPLRLLTKNLERMRIDTQGWVGIGTTAPTAKLHVLGNGLFTSNLRISNSGLTSYHASGAGVTATGKTYGVLATNNGLGVWGIQYQQPYCPVCECPQLWVGGHQ